MISGPTASGNELRSTLLQLVRFGVTGVAITLLAAAIYWTSSEWLGVSPMIGNSIAFVICVVIGYFAHSRISFGGHGTRDDSKRTGSRFLVVNLFGYALNSLWVWSLVEYAGGPTWWAIVPMVIVTPIATFILHRLWTFR